MSERLTRRALLRTAGGGALAGLAGCQRVPGDLVWRTDVPNLATATTDGDRLYVAGADEVRAVDLGDRTTAWTAPVEAHRRAPVLADGTLVAGARDGVYALDPADGTVRWTRSTGRPAQLPAVAHGTVYVGTRGEDESGRLRALALADGSVEWSVDAGGASDEAPPAVTDDAVYLGTWQGQVRAHGRADGSERWTFGTDDWLAAQPVVADGTVYTGSNDERVYALGAADGQERWSFDCDGSAADTPIVGESTVYATSIRYLFALDREA